MVTHGSIEVLTKEYNCLVKITDDIRQVVEKWCCICYNSTYDNRNCS